VHILETIVVEGRDDERAVKQAVNAEVIITHGFCISDVTFKNIESARKKNGVIIFTDPDPAGEQIRKRLNDRIKGCKNAFLTQVEAVKEKDIGIEHAEKESIIKALTKAKCITCEKHCEFTMDDLNAWGLMGAPNAALARQELSRLLGIGYSNAKQFVKQLNHYGITREEFILAVSKLKNLIP